MSTAVIRQKCLDRFSATLDEQSFNTWVLPIQATLQNHTLFLYFPNQLVLDRFENSYIRQLEDILQQVESSLSNYHLRLEVLTKLHLDLK